MMRGGVLPGPLNLHCSEINSSVLLLSNWKLMVTVALLILGVLLMKVAVIGPADNVRDA